VSEECTRQAADINDITAETIRVILFDGKPETIRNGARTFFPSRQRKRFETILDQTTVALTDDKYNAALDTDLVLKADYTYGHVLLACNKK
jgi:hypothetical protein